MIRTLILAIALTGCAGGTPFAGTKDGKGSQSAPTDDDEAEEDETSTPPVEVSGAFLVTPKCVWRDAASDGAVSIACGLFDPKTGAPAAGDAAISGVKVSYNDGSTDAAAKATDVAAADGYGFGFHLALDRAAQLSVVTVAYDAGGKSGSGRVARAAIGGTAPTNLPDAACQPGQFQSPLDGSCELAYKLHLYAGPVDVDGSVDAVAAVEYEAASFSTLAQRVVGLKYAEYGSPALVLAPSPACTHPATCPVKENALADGTVPLFVLYHPVTLHHMFCSVQECLGLLTQSYVFEAPLFRALAAVGKPDALQLNRFRRDVGKPSHAFAVGTQTLADWSYEGALGSVLDPTKVNTP